VAVEEEALCFASSSCNRFTTFLSQGEYFLEIEFKLVTQFSDIKNIFYWLIRKGCLLYLLLRICIFLQQALMMTIVNLAQNFVGSNNVNLLQPIGQFGTRLHGGKDAASPRYIFTMLR